MDSQQVGTRFRMAVKIAYDRKAKKLFGLYMDRTIGNDGRWLKDEYLGWRKIVCD
ncbi:hypothetical protein LCGC14_0817560 [marine sediment metagenome]|uniref:Uncharacterized protein n=1 Tax=marine sediment metagenome TaxID=412755 RepID=A0A0F9PJR3_9ZZZZ